MILVSLLGNFDSHILPIFYEFSDRLTHHIIIHDDSFHEAKKVNKLRKAQEKFKRYAKLNYKLETMQFDEDSFKSIKKCYEKIVKYCDYDYENIYFNGTGGLASTSLIIAQMLLLNGSSFVAYDFLDNSYNLITKKSMEKIQITKNQSIFEHFMLKGYSIDTSGNIEEAQKRKKNIFQLCSNLDELKLFASKLQNKTFDNINKHSKIKKILIKIGKTDQAYVQGGIFEEYIFWLLKDNFDFDDIMFNVKVELDYRVYNEFDILMIKNNHLHVVECKLRYEGAKPDFIYKLDALTDYIDDDGKAMLVSVSSKKELNFALLRRAKYVNLKIYQKKQFDEMTFIKEAKEHFFS